ncbi:MAG: hypothetical protein H0V88_11560 [Pyrinomonadaceae bacterium]|nr:hypothetical protein [Pyrinomonadaceae bacterium]
MSDYLWNKTGEVDSEIERLEEALRPLRYQPQVLELPAHAKPERPRTTFYFPLVAAAILAIIALAGMWARLIHTDSHKNQPQAVGNLPSPDVRAPQESNPNVQQATVTQTDAPIAPQNTNSSLYYYQQSKAARHASPRTHRESLALRVKNENRKQQTFVASDEQQARLREKREGELAKDRLMFALNITSRKLNIAQRKVAATTSHLPGVNEENR